MRKYSSSTPNEASEELLRTTLQEHTSPIDLNSTWATVAERLALQDRQVRHSTKLLSLLSRPRFSGRRWRTMPVMVAVVMLAVFLMGASAVVADSVGGKALKEEILTKLGFPPANQFQHIGQKQLSAGVTITLEDVDATSDRTIIYLSARLSPSLLKSYVGIFPNSFDFVVNGVKEKLTLEKVLSCNVDLRNHNEGCEFVLSPLHSSTPTKTFNVTWNLTEVILSVTSTTHKPPTILHGHWHFQFTLTLS